MHLQNKVLIYDWTFIHLVHRPFSTIKLDLKCITTPYSYELWKNEFATKITWPTKVKKKKSRVKLRTL